MKVKRRNKKAISALVATVLLVLITIAAVGIIWGAIMPIIKTGMEKSQKCMDAQLDIDTRLGYTCFKVNIDGSKTANVRVVRGEKETEITAVLIRVTDTTGNSVIYDACDTGCDITKTIPKPNEAKVYTIDMSSNDANATSIAVASRIKIGMTENDCSMINEVMLPDCTT